MIWLHWTIKPFIIFVIGYITFRFIGKKAAAQMSSFDLLVILILGNVLTEPILEENIWMTAYNCFAICLIYIGFIKLMIHFPWAKKLLFEKPVILVRNGKIEMKALAKSGMTVEELKGELRSKGQEKIEDVELAILEEVGSISVKAKKKNQKPRTNKS